jgi:hypothetical protein
MLWGLSLVASFVSFVYKFSFSWASFLFMYEYCVLI